MARKSAGIRKRHRRNCAAPKGRCSCSPTYEAYLWVGHGDGRRKISRTFKREAEARTWRTDSHVKPLPPLHLHGSGRRRKRNVSNARSRPVLG